MIVRRDSRTAAEVRQPPVTIAVCSPATATASMRFTRSGDQHTPQMIDEQAGAPRGLSTCRVDGGEGYGWQAQRDMNEVSRFSAKASLAVHTDRMTKPRSANRASLITSCALTLDRSPIRTARLIGYPRITSRALPGPWAMSGGACRSPRRRTGGCADQKAGDPTARRFFSFGKESRDQAAVTELAGADGDVHPFLDQINPAAIQHRVESSAGWAARKA